MREISGNYREKTTFLTRRAANWRSACRRESSGPASSFPESAPAFPSGPAPSFSEAAPVLSVRIGTALFGICAGLVRPNRNRPFRRLRRSCRPDLPRPFWRLRRSCRPNRPRSFRRLRRSCPSESGPVPLIPACSPYLRASGSGRWRRPRPAGRSGCSRPYRHAP